MHVEQEAAIEELWDVYLDTRDPKAKNAILTYYLYLVVGIAKRVMPLYKDYCEKNDLINDGVLGLIEAVEKYDRSFETKFPTYAAKRIKGAMLDQLRKQDWASSTLRKKLSGIQKASMELESEMGRQPTEKEVARRLEMPEREVMDALQTSQMFNVISFETLLYENNCDDGTGGIRDDPYADVERKEIIQSIHGALDKLQEKERMVIVLHYYEGFTMKNISKILGVSESRISQIHSKALMRIKKAIER